jgi:hypothetical protein
LISQQIVEWTNNSMYVVNSFHVYIMTAFHTFEPQLSATISLSEISASSYRSIRSIMSPQSALILLYQGRTQLFEPLWNLHSSTSPLQMQSHDTHPTKLSGECETVSISPRCILVLVTVQATTLTLSQDIAYVVAWEGLIWITSLFTLNSLHVAITDLNIVQKQNHLRHWFEPASPKKTSEPHTVVPH